MVISGERPRTQEPPCLILNSKSIIANLVASQMIVCLFVCFVALRPKSTAMVIAGRSVHLTTLFSWASSLPVIVHILSLVTDNNPS